MFTLRIPFTSVREEMLCMFKKVPTLPHHSIWSHLPFDKFIRPLKWKAVGVPEVPDSHS